jgi:tetratricopeptide (TPR) repeat protein
VLERRAVLEKLPFFALALLFGAIALDVQAGGNLHGWLRVADHPSPALGPLASRTLVQRTAVACYGYAMYVWKLFVPLGLCAFHPYPPPGTARGAGYAAAALFLVATLMVAVWDARRSRVLAFGIGWYFITVAPVLQWVQVGSAILAERYTYLPYIGLCFAWAMGMQAALDRNRALGAGLWGASVLFGMFLSAATLRQIETWKDSEALWTRTIEVHPTDGTRYVWRGMSRVDDGRMSEALGDFRVAMSLGAASADLFDGLGNAYCGLGKCDSSLAMYHRALELEPGRGNSYRNRAVAYLRLGRAREALADLDRALELMPEHAALLWGPRGYAFKLLRDYPRAVAEFDRAIAADPRDPVSFYNRGFCRLMLGDRAGAAEDFRAVLRLDPGNAAARQQLHGLGVQPSQ